MNNINFWTIQLVGLEALILLVISYYKKKPNQILLIQILSTLFFSIHFFLLKAYAGFIMCVFEMIRDFLYYKSKKDNLIFYSLIPFYLLFGVITYNKTIDVFPILASLCDAFFLTKSKKHIVIGSIITYLIWLIYEFYYRSFSGVLTSIIVVLSSSYILIFDKSISSKTQRMKDNLKRLIKSIKKI